MPPSTDLPQLPRVALLDCPTPLQPMARLSAALGGRAELWIKREDAGSIAFSGNKLRNLEFLLGAAVAEGADAIVTSGRRWSNHCRLAAAAGARVGLEVHLVLSGPRVARSPNRDLIELFGGVVHEAETDGRAEREALVESVAADLRAAGRRVKVVPVGGSEAAGAWGQVLAGIEVMEQAAALGFVPDAIVLPSATGGTQAGLTVGTDLVSEGRNSPIPAHPAPRVLGVLVARPEPELRPAIERLTSELAAMAGVVAPLDRVELDVTQPGAGYGVRAARSVEAARPPARTAGSRVAPSYTAKALAGLIDLLRSGALDGRRAVFWHGGGLPALFEPLD